jgi:hypothetical protein
MNEDSNKPSIRKEDYENSYEYQRQWLSAFEKEDDMDYYPKSYSFFVKSGSVPITGKVQKIKPVEYAATMNIKEAFDRLKHLMHTKQNKLRKSMTELKPYEEYTLIALINYLREEWTAGCRGDIVLTWTEFFYLKNGTVKNNYKNKK